MVRTLSLIATPTAKSEKERVERKRSSKAYLRSRVTKAAEAVGLDAPPKVLITFLAHLGITHLRKPRSKVKAA